MIKLNNCSLRFLSLVLVFLIISANSIFYLGSFKVKAQSTHSFLYADSDDFSKIKNLGFGKNEYLTNWYQNIRTRAEKVYSNYDWLQSYPTSFGDRTLSWGVDAEEEIMLLSLVYLVEGNELYAEKAKNMLLNLCSKNYWGNVLLDNSASARAAAIGYNWLYNYLEDGDKQSVKNAIYKNSLSLIYDIYVNSAAYESSTNPDNPTKTNQIGAVFGLGNHASHNNAHYAVVAAALINDYPAQCSLIIDNSIKEIKEILESVYGDGVYNEGVGYWNYFLPPIVRMISALESTGMSNPFVAYKKLISESAYFRIYTDGINGDMIYGDMYTTDYPVSEEIYYVARMTNDFNLQKIMRSRDNPDALLMPLWFDETINLNNAYTNIVRDKHYSEGTLSTMRSSWTDPYASFVGFRGGKANSTHMDASSGSFTFDALGERWTAPLGLDNYSLSGYTNFTKVNSDGLWRWDYYTNRAEANNCLVINPDDGPGQDINAVPILEATESKADYAAATLDLSSVYPDSVSYKRTVKLFDQRKKLSVKDVLTLNSPSEIYWLMNTKAKIELSSNGKTAILSLDDKKLKAEIVSDNDACKFSILKAGPHTVEDGGLGYVPTLAKGDVQLSGIDAASVDGMQRLSVHLEAVTNLSLEIILTPMWSWQTTDTVYEDTECIYPLCNTFVTDAAPGVIMKAQEFYELQKSKSHNSVLHYDFNIDKFTGKNIISASLNIFVKPYNNTCIKLSYSPQLSRVKNSEDVTYLTYDSYSEASRKLNGRYLATDKFTKVSLDVTDELITAIKNGDKRLALSIFAADDMPSHLIVASNRNSESSLRPEFVIRYAQ